MFAVVSVSFFLNRIIKRFKQQTELHTYKLTIIKPFTRYVRFLCSKDRELSLSLAETLNALGVNILEDRLLSPLVSKELPQVRFCALAQY